MNAAPLVDCHAHIWTGDMPFVDNPRHKPDYAFTAEDYLATLDAHGVTHAVLAAASLFDTYNDYVTESLRRHPRLRGTVILDPDTDHYTMERMKADGVVGVRWPWISLATVPDIDNAAWRRHLRRIRDLDWHLHLHVGPGRLPAILPFVLASGVKLVIDHFGYPDPKLGVGCPSFQAVLRAVDNGRTWVKLSGGYRVGPQRAIEYARELLRVAGPERLVWGSDCPFASFETQVTYQQTVDDLTGWVPDPAARRIIAAETPLALYFA